MKIDLDVTDVIIFEDNEADGHLLKDVSNDFGHRAEVVTNLAQASQLAENPKFGIALVTLSTDNNAGLQLVATLKACAQDFIIVAIAQNTDFDVAVEAMRAGAVDVITKPLEPQSLTEMLERCKELRRREAQRNRRSITQELMNEVTSSPDHLEGTLQSHNDVVAAIQEEIPVSAAILDHQGNITFVNDTWLSFANSHGGTDEYEWIGKNYLEHASNGIRDDIDSIKAVAGIRAVLDAERESFEYIYPCQISDSEFWFRMTIRQLHDREPLSAVVMHTDVTDMMISRRKAEENERRLRSIVDTIVWGIITIDEDGVIEEINPAISDIFGYTEDEMIDKNVNMLMPEQDSQHHDNYLRNFADTGEAKIVGSSREVVGRHKDGSMLQLNLGVNEVVIDGHKHFIGMIVDISEQKSAEKALRESEARTQAILDTSPHGVSITSWRTDQRQYANPRLVEMMGADSAEHLLSTPIDMSYVDTIERPRRADIADPRLFAKGMEVRRRRFDGSQWWSLMHCKVIDVAGEKMIVSWHLDIDDRKQTERYLQENEARLRNVLENSPVGVSIVSRKTRKRVYVNQRAVEMFGADSSEELMAEDVDKSYADNEEYEVVLENNGQGNAAIESENKRYRKDGSEWWCLSTRRLIKYGGEEALFIWMYDITERREMQHALTDSEGRFRDFASTAADWYWEMDEDLRYTYFSDRYQEITGTDPRERIGKSLLEIGIQGLSDEEFERRINIHRERQPFRNHVHQRQFPDGRTVYLSISGTPIFDADGSFQGYRGTGTDITDVVMAEHRVRESEERFQLLAAASPAGVFYVDPEGLCLFVNDAFATMTGVPVEDFKNTPWYRAIYHKDIANFVANWRPKVSDGAAFDTELRFAHPDGSIVWAKVNASPHRAADGTFLGYLGTAIDIDERKSVERELLELETRAAAVLDNAPAAIYVKDTGGRYLQINSRFKEVFDVEDDALGKTDDEIFSHKVAQVLQKNDEMVLTSKEPTEEEETINLPSGLRTFLTSRVPLCDTRGRAYAVCAISTDITERKMTEAQLLHASKMASIGSMSAGIAHELSQPLNIMNLIAENKLIELEEGEATLEDVHKSLTTVSEQCGRMAQTIMHMGVFSRIDDAEHKLFAVKPVLEQTIALLKQPFLAEGVALETDLPDDCGFALGHDSQFEQVLINLLTNARDAMKGSTTIAASGIPEISLSCLPNPEDQTVQIIIEDQGPGIPDRVMPRIFDPFYTTKEPGKGTGLGLAICMGIINSMGGTIRAANTPTGARFTIALPLRHEDPKPSKTDSQSAKGPVDNASIAAGRSIMVVDDEQSAASTLALHLRRLGYDVSTANDGIEALSQFIDEPVDLVITDLRMPRMDGEELIKKLRADNADLPVVIITGDLDAGGLLETLPGTGPVHLLRKPLIIRNLYEHLEEIFQPSDN